MKLSKKLINKSQPILEAIETHPFITGIGHGSVPKEALAFYVGQDFNYLNAFTKVYAAAIQKCDDWSQMQLFADQIEFILNGEIRAHEVFCEIAQINYSSLQHAQQAPMTYLYNEHMYNAARTGDLIDVVAAMLPCPWTYNEIGKHLVEKGLATDENPFQEWIEFYASVDSEDKASSDRLFAILDTEAKKYRPEYLQQVENRFLKSCELELRFWEQAMQRVDWQFADLFN